MDSSQELSTIAQGSFQLSQKLAKKMFQELLPPIKEKSMKRWRESLGEKVAYFLQLLHHARVCRIKRPEDQVQQQTFWQNSILLSNKNAEYSSPAHISCWGQMFAACILIFSSVFSQFKSGWIFSQFKSGWILSQFISVPQSREKGKLFAHFATNPVVARGRAGGSSFSNPKQPTN